MENGDTKKTGATIIAFPLRPQRQVAPKPLTSGAPIQSQTQVQQSIQGSGNVQVSGNYIVNNTTIAGGVRQRKLPTPDVPPTDEHITQEQRAKLQALIKVWVETSNSVKRYKKIGYQGAWAALNRRMGVSSYKYIKRERFDAAVLYVQGQTAMLLSMPSAKTKVTNYADKRIKAIKARCANQLGDVYAYLPYIKRKFGAESLTELGFAQLEATYKYIMNKKS